MMIHDETFGSGKVKGFSLDTFPSRTAFFLRPHGFWQIWAAPTPQAMEHPVRPNFLSKSTRPSRPMLPQEWLLLALVTGDW
jgi:hypothetical protein